VGGDTEAAALLDFLLERSAAPFFGMLRAWLHRGVCDDPHGEFFIAEDARIRKEGLLTDFACAYWEKRFTLRPELVPAFIAPHAQAALDCGKLLHVVRECGREPANPRPDRLAYTLDERALGLAIGEARAWASQQALGVLVGEAQLLQRLQSVKHYFLLDQVREHQCGRPRHGKQNTLYRCIPPFPPAAAPLPSHVFWPLAPSCPLLLCHECPSGPLWATSSSASSTWPPLSPHTTPRPPHTRTPNAHFPSTSLRATSSSTFWTQPRRS
jgi:hypothetical protein